jgi:hypothetical protein
MPLNPQISFPEGDAVEGADIDEVDALWNDVDGSVISVTWIFTRFD